MGPPLHRLPDNPPVPEGRPLLVATEGVPMFHYDPTRMSADERLDELAALLAAGRRILPDSSRPGHGWSGFPFNRTPGCV